MTSAEVKHEVTYDLEVQEDEKRIWKSCCLKTDKYAVVYLGQFVITLLILGFCALQLARSNYDCDKSSPYLGLISFILGKLLATVTTTH